MGQRDGFKTMVIVNAAIPEPLVGRNGVLCSPERFRERPNNENAIDTSRQQLLSRFMNLIPRIQIEPTLVQTMKNPLAEIAAHKLMWLYDVAFGTNFDMDLEPGMQSEEECYVTDPEILDGLARMTAPIARGRPN